MAKADNTGLWQHARANAFVLVTQDSDFADILSLYGQPTQAIETLLRDHVQAIAAFAQDPTATCLKIL